MNVRYARFVIQHNSLYYGVDFDAGRVSVTAIPSVSPLLTVDNTNRRYKPCATHAMELVRQVVGKPAAEGWEKQRRKAQVPKLGLVNGKAGGK